MTTRTNNIPLNTDKLCKKTKDRSLGINTKIQPRKKVNKYIHLSCRNSLKNKSCKKQTFEDEHSTATKRACRRSKIEKIDFTKQCFYCGKVCFFNSKHPDHDPFEMVATKDTGIYYNTLKLCKFCKDNAKLNSVERRLLRYLCFAVNIVKHFQDL